MITVPPRTPIFGHDRPITTALTFGSAIEVIGGGVAAVVAIVGLAGHDAPSMAAIAAVGIGGALLARGISVGVRRWKVARRVVAGQVDSGDIKTKMGSELVGGLGGSAIGILALVGVSPLSLLTLAAIVFGGALVFGADHQPELARLAPDLDRGVGHYTHTAVAISTRTMTLIGWGSIVLGSLALLDVGATLTLVLVAMLGVGVALVFAGGALTARFGRHLQSC